MAEAKADNKLSSESLVKDVLQSIDREREREIISRRFGLFDRKETLEQIGELLGITRERVRQLEKAVISKLKSSSEAHKLAGIDEFQSLIMGELAKTGHVARISDLTNKLVGDPNRIEQSRMVFLSSLCPDLVVIQDDDSFYACVSEKALYNEKSLKEATANIVKTVTKIGEPKKIDYIAKQANVADTKLVSSLASTSKQLATLNDLWGLIKWPLVNPKNIRDKIYVILKENGNHMHFNEIAEAIKDSDFKRKNVTTQAIHNELIKDKRFVLIGRGLYALKEWGYEKGTVADIISQVLREAGEPLHRDEIVKRVLKSRFVKETTILLNLQGKPQFHRVAKATYELVEPE